MNTLEELKERLRERDQMDLVDILEITSEQIVDRFDDVIEDKFEELADPDDSEED